MARGGLWPRVNPIMFGFVSAISKIQRSDWCGAIAAIQSQAKIQIPLGRVTLELRCALLLSAPYRAIWNYNHSTEKSKIKLNKYNNLRHFNAIEIYNAYYLQYR
jgi:hypothetical protein